MELTRYSFHRGHERGFNTHAMDVFFLGFRQKGLLTTRNAMLKVATFQNGGQAKEGKKRTKAV